MEESKIVIIFGKDKLEEGIHEGEIRKIGELVNEYFHSTLLINFAKKNYSEIPIFQKLSNRHIPEVIAYFYTLYFNHIIFLNTTSVNNNIVSKNKQGIFIMPDEISETQKEALYSFLEGINNYSISILYDLKLVDGVLDGKEINSFRNTPLDLFERYYSLKDNNKVYQHKFNK